MKLTFVSVGVACIACIVIFFTIPSYGIAWDEPIYFVRADGYITWLMNPNWQTIDKYWRADLNDLHPPLRQIITGISKEVFSNRLNLLDQTRGYRSSTLLFVFAALFTLTFYAGRRYGIGAALFAGIGLLSTPQLYYLAHIASIDFALMTL